MTHADSSRRFHLKQIILRLVLGFGTLAVLNSVFFADVNQFYRRVHDLSFAFLPYKDFLWEYPPFTIIPMLLLPLFRGNQDLYTMGFMLIMMAAEYASLLMLRRARPERADDITWWWTRAVLPLATIGWFRFDFLAVVCATFAVTAIAANRRYVFATFFGFGIKLWPLVLGVAMVLQRRWRDAFITGAACIALVVGWYAFSPEGFKQFLEFRQGDGFQIESIPGTFLLLTGSKPDLKFGAVAVSDAGWEWVQVLLQVVFLVVPLGLLAVAWVRKNVDVIALIGGMVCVAVLSTRLLSPQFLLWVAPFVAWYWPETKRLGKIFMVAAWLTFAIIELYVPYIHGAPIPVLMAIVRNGLMIWLAVELLQLAFRKPKTAEAQAKPASGP